MQISEQLNFYHNLGWWGTTLKASTLLYGRNTKYFTGSISSLCSIAAKL